MESGRNGLQPSRTIDDDLRPSGSRTRMKPVLETVPTPSPTRTTISPDIEPSQSTGHGHKNVTSSRDKLSKDFRFCRATKLVPTDPTTAASPGHQLDVWYQCTGKDYDRFARNLTALVHEQIESGERPPNWGHRPAPLPDDRSLFVFGNSHLRQVAVAWICQYNDQLTELYHYGDDVDEFMVTRARFRNNATVWLVINSWVPYTEDWPQNLAEQLRLDGTTALKSEMDGVVVGVFNRCTTSPSVPKSNFVAHMESIAANRTDMPCEGGTGPSITSIASVFVDKPILFIPIFSLSRNETAREMRNEMEDLKRMGEGRTTAAAALDPRRYIEMMGNECGANSKLDVTECRNDERARDNMHRCMGPMGSHPDLVAWDAAEYFHDVLSPTP